MAESKGEKILRRQLESEGYKPIPEYRFHDTRLWRFDFILDGTDIAIEVEGGLHNGRHTRAKGYAADLVKYNTATGLGWRVFRFSTAQVTSGYAIKCIRSVMAGTEMYHI